MIKVNLIAPIKIINNLVNILDHVININSMVGMEPKKIVAFMLHLNGD